MGRLRKLIQSIPPISFYWGAGMLGNILNWLFNLILVRNLHIQEYGLLTIIITFQFLISIPALALQTTSNKFNTHRLNQLFTLGIFLSFGLTILYLITLPITNHYLQLPTHTIQIPTILIILSFFPLALYRGLFNAQERYRLSGLLILIEGITKLLFAMLTFMTPAPLLISLYAIPLSMIIPLGYSYYRLKTFPFLFQKPEPSTLNFLLQSFILGIGVILPLTIDILIVRSVLPMYQADIYALLSLIGKTIFFVIYSIIGLLIPILASRAQNGTPSLSLLYGIIGFTLLSSLTSLAVFYFLPQISLAVLLGDKYLLIYEYIPMYTLAITSLCIAATFATYHLMQNNFLYPILSLVAALAEIILLSYFHTDLHQIITVIFYTFTGLALAMGVSHALQLKTPLPLKNYNDQK